MSNGCWPGNSDNTNYDEMIWADNGTEEGIKVFMDRGIECLRELLADICDRDDE